MKSSLAIGIAIGAFLVGVVTTYLVTHSDYEELHLKETLVFSDFQSKNQITLPVGSILVRGGNIPWAPDDTFTAFLPIYVPSTQVTHKRPFAISGKTYYGLSSANASK